MAKVTNNY